MTEEKHPLLDWTKVAAELRAYREFQQETWGTVSDMTIAKFVSGTSTHEEAQQVQQAAGRYPAIQRLIEVVGGPALLQKALGASAAPRTTKSVANSWRLEGLVTELTQTLRGWVEDAGLAASGMTDWLVQDQQQERVGMLMGETENAQQPSLVWRIPVPDQPDTIVHIEIQQVEADQWDLACQIEIKQQPYVGADARLEVHDANGGLEHSGSLAEAQEPIHLESGMYQLTLSLEGTSWRVPLEIGAPPPS